MTATFPLEGDCLDILRGLDSNSVDAIVTDPPYGLAEHKPAALITALTAWANGDREHVPDGKGFMGRDWDAFVPPPAVWDECLRVLKPGGHLLAFAGSRTADLMGLSVRMAGFEIRDTIMWVYGSGFPKSLDVSKAIDKAGGDPLAFRQFARAYAIAVESSTLTHADVDRHLGVKSSSCYWVREDHRGKLPPRHHWNQVRDLLGLDGGLEQLYDEAERADRLVSDPEANSVFSPTQHVLHAGTPQTTAAIRWQGWGTALKPAFEPLVVAVKPQDTAGILAGIGSHLDRLEAECSSRARQPDATSSSAPIRLDEPAAKTDSAPASAATPREDEQAPTTPTGAAAGSSATTDTSWSESTATTCLNTVTSWRACWAELSALTSTCTTSTAIEPTTDLRTLLFCLSRTTAESMAASCGPSAGSSSDATAADALFGAVLLSSRATLALSATGLATDGTLTSPQGVTGRGSPAQEPIIVARKPLSGTVATTVLGHGTGALNIDGCRTAHASDADLATSLSKNPGRIDSVTSGVYGAGRPQQSVNTAGRWPSNVVLTHAPDCVEGGACVAGCPVADLDQQSGITKDGVAVQRNGGGQKIGGQGIYGGSNGLTRDDQGFGGSGGASRFFPVFRYQAKAPARERPEVDGVKHPTVKPLALMQWLVRLVTPPGGIVLDPFAGSGTTLEAARAEGFDSIGIERDPAYYQLILRRLGYLDEPAEVAS